jgi:NAD(P)-dependent dehydrogenase (short-subunit alcohol dehydrogenase family)
MPDTLFDLTGDIAVVIGATGVLGGAIAEGLARAGAHVAVLGRSQERGQACVKRITGAGDAKLGPPTVLVNAAGGNDPKTTVTPDNPVEKIATDAWRASFETNLVGGILLPCQEFGPAMVARGKGSIINIASVTAHIPLSRVMAYSSSKAAVLSLSQFLAREWAPKKVRVNTITPGFFPAEQNRALLYNQDGSPTARTQSILGHTPMARFGEPKELVGAAIFLASHAASGFITGTDIRVDGGFLSQTI